jgi:excisionase family DNA binding protein
MANKRKTAKDDYNVLHWAAAPDLLTTAQAATLANAHFNTVAGWLESGKIDFILVGRTRRLKKIDLAAHLDLTLAADGSIAPTSDILAAYAGEIETAMALPGPAAFEAIADIARRMKNH